MKDFRNKSPPNIDQHFPQIPRFEISNCSLQTDMWTICNTLSFNERNVQNEDTIRLPERTYTTVTQLFLSGKNLYKRKQSLEKQKELLLSKSTFGETYMSLIVSYITRLVLCGRLHST